MFAFQQHSKENPERPLRLDFLVPIHTVKTLRDPNGTIGVTREPPPAPRNPSKGLPAPVNGGRHMGSDRSSHSGEQAKQKSTFSSFPHLVMESDHPC